MEVYCDASGNGYISVVNGTRIHVHKLPKNKNINILEYRAILLAHNLYPDATIYSDSVCAIHTARKYLKNIDLHLIRSKENKADEFATPRGYALYGYGS